MDGALHVSGTYVRRHWRVAELSAVWRATGATVRVPAEGDRDFTAVLPLDEVRPLSAGEDDVADLWLHLAPRAGVEDDADVDRPDPADTPGPVRLGNFARTLRPAGAEGGCRVADDRVAVTQKGNVSLLLGGAPGRKFQVEVENLQVQDARVEVGVVVRGADRRAREARIVVAARETSTRHVFACRLDDLPEESLTDRGRFVQRASCVIDLADLAERLDLRDDTVDLYVEVEDADGLVQTKRVNGDGHHDRLRTGRVTRAGQVVQFVPYATFRGANVSMHVERMSEDSFACLRRWTRAAWLLPLVRPFAGVWLVGELPYKAQDNGYHLFRWLRENQPGRKVYYVIDEHAPDLQRVAPLGNVVLRNSREHIRAAFLANRIISTHHAEYLLPSRTAAAARGVRGVRVFLQHGVMGTKNMVANYGKLAPGFATDRFHVSSDREREMIINDFGFRPAQVRVTGLSRTDELLAPAQEPPSGLLVIPTWREWLGDRQSFEASDYRERWQGFLSHPRLKEAVSEGLPVTFILHPNMRRFADLFDVPGVRVVRQGEADVQTLLREHACLVTDYSSVGFDFAFQRRPVVYFQFDRQRFIGPRGSHLDLESDLPGQIVRDVDTLVDEVVRAAAGGFVMPEEHWARAARLLRHPDRQNNQRVTASVRSAGGPGVQWWRLLDGAAVQGAVLRFRRGSAYPRAMALLMGLARMLPRRRSVVFEAGNGRQYADSPRAIYEELVRRDTGLRTVWSTTGTFRPLDLRTRKVVPRSPRYYWELGRAKIWVNNQNFPIDVRPSRRTLYLQTWHGTPLKRMQHDAVSTTGRTEGYLDRVARMTGYWSALVSPSPFATARFRSAFRFDGPVIEEGYPRNDVLVSGERDELARLVKRRVGLDPETRLILFAPTFRDNEKTGARFAFDPHVDLEELADRLPPGTVLGIRKHGIIRQAVQIPEAAQGRVVDVSSYPDVQDLLAAADALVTDYSSLMFDFALTRRPMLFYCYDLEEYRDELRGFYFDFEDAAPGPILRTQDELFAALDDLHGVRDAYAPQLDEFVTRFGPWEDGGSASRVVNEMLRMAR